MQILLIGENGQLSSSFRKYFSEQRLEFTSTSRNELDLSDEASVKNFFEKYKFSENNNEPKLIINASAYTNVEKAEIEPELAMKINGESNKIISNFARDNGFLYVYYSTDYVFDGTKKTPYTEEDTPNPINQYGLSKLKGEDYVRSIADNFLIIRTSWVFSETGENFVKKIRNLISTKEEIKVISDQVGCPTSSDFLAYMSFALLNKLHKEGNINNIREIINISQPSPVSWYEFACSIRKYMKGQNLAKIESIRSEEYNSKATRPKNSILNTEKLKNLLGVNMLKSWGDDLKEIIEKLENAG